MEPLPWMPNLVFPRPDATGAVKIDKDTLGKVLYVLYTLRSWAITQLTECGREPEGAPDGGLPLDAATPQP